jgi:poly-gamma-glutamate synthesis protein (capsule biosynthesis protein)
MTDITIALGGDVITGRGVDQALASPGDPTTGEHSGRRADDYLRLLEAGYGPLERPLADEAIWGDVPAWLAQRGVGLRIANLETAVTTSLEAWPNKRYRFRMHPGNIGCLEAASLDCLTLANNHVLDWGAGGLTETLDTLHSAGFATAGAGRSLDEAARPAILHPPSGPRVLVFSAAHVSSFTPRPWAASGTGTGIWLLDGYDRSTLDSFRARIEQFRAPGDLVIASLHWGPNWGYEVNFLRRSFARAIIDHAGVDIVHGHSSHHPIGLELHRGRPILYGCGDLVNDYGATQPRFRNDIGGWYVLGLRAPDYRPSAIEFLPLRRDGLRIERPTPAEISWLAERMTRGDAPHSLAERVYRLRHLSRLRFCRWRPSPCDTLVLADEMRNG